MSSPFAIFFTGHSYPISSAAFAQSDATHLVLDVISSVTPNYAELKEVALFLTQPNSLPPDAALALYVSIGGANWSYRGCVSVAHPSEVMPLSWPAPPEGAVLAAGFAQIGVCLEPLAEVSQKEGSKLGAKEDFAKMVGLDLFNFMQSFGGVANVGPNQLLVPANVLDHWYTRLSSRLRRDPDFLTRTRDKV